MCLTNFDCHVVQFQIFVIKERVRKANARFLSRANWNAWGPCSSWPWPWVFLAECGPLDAAAARFVWERVDPERTSFRHIRHGFFWFFTPSGWMWKADWAPGLLFTSLVMQRRSLVFLTDRFAYVWASWGSVIKFRPTISLV